MSELLIFGGTTEGRLLAEYCAENKIDADVSVATEYGASLLPEKVNVLCGRLDSEHMAELIHKNNYNAIIDATHPYAVEASENIRSACTLTNRKYLRLIRKSSVTYGRIAKDIDELLNIIDNSTGIILSTLGSKSLASLAAVKHCNKRMWLRLLPADGVIEVCQKLGYDPSKIILEKGPFTVEQNIEHIRKSGASLVVTKESGEAGGYPEKAEAAKQCRVELITLIRPQEQGYTFDEMTDFIDRELRK